MRLGRRLVGLARRDGLEAVTIRTSPSGGHPVWRLHDLVMCGREEAASLCTIRSEQQRTIGLRVPPAYENDLDQAQEALSAYALGRQDGGLQPADDDTVGPAMPMAPVGEEMKLVRALVDHEDLNELRAALVEAGAVQIVLSEASLYTYTPRTEVFRGQRRKIAFDPRLRLEVIVPESDVQRVVQAMQRIPGVSTYLQVIDASLAAAVGGERAPRT